VQGAPDSFDLGQVEVTAGREPPCQPDRIAAARKERCARPASPRCRHWSRASAWSADTVVPCPCLPCL